MPAVAEKCRLVDVKTTQLPLKTSS